MEKKILVKAESGLHARPAGAIVQMASKFKSEITINGMNAKSIMNVMSLGVGHGEEVTIKVDGDDAQEALTSLATLIEGLE